MATQLSRDELVRIDEGNDRVILSWIKRLGWTGTSPQTTLSRVEVADPQQSTSRPSTLINRTPQAGLEMNKLSLHQTHCGSNQ